MANRSDCEKFSEQLFMLDTEPSGELLEHINACPECQAQYRKLAAMSQLIKSNVPPVPNIKDAVMEKLRTENISIAPTSAKRSRRFPVATIAAAVAVLAAFATFGTKETNNSDAFSKAKVTGNALTAESAVENDIMMYSYSADSEAQHAPSAYMTDTDGAVTEDGADNGRTVTITTAEEYLMEDAVEECIPEAEMQAQPELASEELPSMPEEAEAETEASPYFGGTETKFTLGSKEGGQESSPQNDKAAAETKPETETQSTEQTATSGAGGAVNEYRNGITEDVSEDNALAVYNAMEQAYPGRISKEVFESMDAQVYLAFISSLEDFESGYTEQALYDFAKLYK